MPALEKDGSGFLEDWQRRDDFPRRTTKILREVCVCLDLKGRDCWWLTVVPNNSSLEDDCYSNNTTSPIQFENTIMSQTHGTAKWLVLLG